MRTSKRMLNRARKKRMRSRKRSITSRENRRRMTCTNYLKKRTRCLVKWRKLITRAKSNMTKPTIRST